MEERYDEEYGKSDNGTANSTEIDPKELSLKTGITESSISHYVNGDRVPRGANLTKIADALGTTTDDLLRKESNDIDIIMNTMK